HSDTTVAKVGCGDASRIIGLIIGNAFVIPRAVEARVDRDRVATSGAARVGERVRFVVVRSRETTARTRFAGARARAAIPADTIGLRRITRHELARRNCLVGTAGASRHREWDRLVSTGISEVE